MSHRLLALAVLAPLAACGPGPLRLTVPPAATEARVAIGFATIEVLDVSLPTYAEGEEIYLQGPGGALVQADAIWADDPARALTLDLARSLGELTDARTAPEPWPFEEPAQAQVDVRVAELVAQVSEGEGRFLMRGQYFVASQDGSGRDRAREFSVSAPLAPGAGPAAIAAARAQATLALAQEIASEGLR